MSFTDALYYRREVFVCMPLFVTMDLCMKQSALIAVPGYLVIRPTSSMLLALLHFCWLPILSLASLHENCFHHLTIATTKS